MSTEHDLALRQNAALTCEETKSSRGLRYQSMKMLWVFFLFSIFGFLLESGWCYLYHGFIESRKSLVIGPFSIIYGLGAVLILLLVDRFKNQSNLAVYLAGAIGGTVFEYCCSVFQELVFGTVSWDYSGKPYAIGGRANLIFSLAWGLLAIFALRTVSPLLDRLIDALQNRAGIIITAAIAIFLAADMLLSTSAVMRQEARANAEPASNAYEAFLDQYYPDEVLNSIYVNMRPAGEKLIRDESGHVVR